jgi:flagellar assembly factor FliW
MRIETSKFGALELQEDQEIAFVQPVIGFPGLLRYALIDTGSRIKWLQSLDDDDVVFPVVDPFAVKPDYDIEIPTSEASMLEMKSVDDVQLWCITVLSGRREEIRANLRAPIVINHHTRKAKQIVLPDNTLPIQYHFMPEAVHSNKEVAHAGSYA